MWTQERRNYRCHVAKVDVLSFSNALGPKFFAVRPTTSRKAVYRSCPED